MLAHQFPMPAEQRGRREEQAPRRQSQAQRSQDHPVGRQQSSYERTLRAVRSHLGEEAFAALWAEGRAMTVGQALAYALAEGSQSAPVAGPSGRA